MIENHLASCEDCRNELSLLRMMTEETVPDPGETFWSAMPGRVYQAVQTRKAGSRTFGLAWLVDRYDPSPPDMGISNSGDCPFNIVVHHQTYAEGTEDALRYRDLNSPKRSCLPNR